MVGKKVHVSLFLFILISIFLLHETILVTYIISQAIINHLITYSIVIFNFSYFYLHFINMHGSDDGI